MGGVLGGGIGMGTSVEVAAGVLTVQPKSECLPERRCSDAEATGGTAGAAAASATAAAAAVADARATQDATNSRAAAKAVEPHTQGRSRLLIRRNLLCCLRFDESLV